MQETNLYLVILLVIIVGIAGAVAISVYQTSGRGTEITFCGALAKVDNRYGKDVVQIDYDGGVIRVWVGELRFFDTQKIKGFYSDYRIDGIIVGTGGCKCE